MALRMLNHAEACQFIQGKTDAVSASLTADGTDALLYVIQRIEKNMSTVFVESDSESFFVLYLEADVLWLDLLYSEKPGMLRRLRRTLGALALQVNAQHVVFGSFNSRLIGCLGRFKAHYLADNDRWCIATRDLLNAK